MQTAKVIIQTAKVSYAKVNKAQVIHHLSKGKPSSGPLSKGHSGLGPFS